MAQKLNATGQQRRFWGTLPIASCQQLMDMGKQMEDTGFEGVFMLQLYGPPFAPLAAVACGTSQLKLASGVASAGTRTPYETAFCAMELDRISGGRFNLGLGSSLPPTLQGLHGLPVYKPVTHLRDTIGAVRHIMAGAHTGLKPYNGVYYKADYQQMVPTQPPIREKIPIWIGAMRDKMTQLGVEIGDGLLAHSLWTKLYWQEHIQPMIQNTLKDFGRQREDIEVTHWPFVAIDNDKHQAIDKARPTVAYYAGIKSYEHIFELHGYLDIARICQEAALRQNDLNSILSKVPDEMVLDFACCGSVDDVLEQLEPFWKYNDILCPMTPIRGLTLEQMQANNEGIYRLVTAAMSS